MAIFPDLSYVFTGIFNPNEHSWKRVEITRCKQVKNTMNNEAQFHLFSTSFALVILTKFQNS
jgi:hypothetical protein